MKTKILLATTASLVLSNTALAQEDALPGRFFVEAGYSGFSSDVDGEIGDYLIKESYNFDTGIFRAGYEINDQFALEIDTTFGTNTANVDESVTVLSTPIDFDGGATINYTVGVLGRYELPIGSDTGLSAFGRFGFVMGEVEVAGTTTTDITNNFVDLTVNIDTSYTESRTGPVFGGGVRYELSETFYVRADATYYALDTFPTYGYALTVGLAF